MRPVPTGTCRHSPGPGKAAQCAPAETRRPFRPSIGRGRLGSPARPSGARPTRSAAPSLPRAHAANSTHIPARIRRTPATSATEGAKRSAFIPPSTPRLVRLWCACAMTARSVDCDLEPASLHADRKDRPPLPSALDEALELLAARRVAQLAEGLGFDLADAFAGHFEVLSHLFEGVVALLADSEAHSQHLLFARRQRLQHLSRLFGKVHVDHRFGRRNNALVLDEVTQVRIFLLADRSLETDRLLGNLEHLPDLVERKLHLLGDLLGGRLAAVLLYEVAARSDKLVDRFDHVHRNANRARLIRDRARDGLPDPPGGIRGELVASLVLELVDRLHQADVSLLNQVEKLKAAVRVLFCNADDQAQIRLD